MTFKNSHHLLIIFSEMINSIFQIPKNNFICESALQKKIKTCKIIFVITTFEDLNVFCLDYYFTIIIKISINMIENPNEICLKTSQGPIPLLSIKGQGFNLNDTKKKDHQNPIYSLNKFLP
jgi:hypothetical protein